MARPAVRARKTGPGRDGGARVQPPSGAGLTRTEAVVQAVRDRIVLGTLTAGERVASVRQQAASMGVSVSTVVEAYGRLEADGLIRARRGAGFYVVGVPAPALVMGGAVSAAERDIDPIWVARQALDAEDAVARPGCGWLPPDWLPVDALRKALRAAARDQSSMLVEYGPTRGDAALRRLLLGRLSDEGLPVGPEQLMLTGSGTQAIDLICRLVLKPGETVVVDDPCYFNFQALLRAHRVNVQGVPMTPDGPDAEAFEALLARDASSRPRLYITNSAVHNPTGATLSAHTAHRLLRAASVHGVTIVEDDIFADFEHRRSPRLALLDGFDRVIRIGSFSKTLSASLRCGYIVGRADWIESLVDLQVATQFGGPGPVSAHVIGRVLAGGSYRRHMDGVRRRLARARTVAMERLGAIGLEPWVVPSSGMFLWCRLPDGLDSADLARHCLAQRVVLAPGNVFSVSQRAGSFVRFNVAQMADPRIVATVGRAVGELRRRR